MTRFVELARELKAAGYREVKGGKGNHTIFESEHGRIPVPGKGSGRDIHPMLVKHIRRTITQLKK
jgi:predicted RNA binding protein YcfA (HicA-like mRNA interferase family)